MVLSCPVCNQKTLRIVHAIELPHDGSYDEIALQVVRCGKCSFNALAAYKESRRGALDREVIHHEAYEVSSQDLLRVSQLITRCAHRNNARCGCQAHLTLSKRSGYRWDALAHLGVKINKVFNL